MNDPKRDQSRKQIEQLAARGVLFSVTVSALVVGLLIWGKLQLKEVPRTAEALPNQSVASQPTQRRSPRPPNTQMAQPAPTLSSVEKSHPEQADDTSVTPSPDSGVLVLQDVITGDPPRARINGQTLVVGQRINGFVLREVVPARVLLEKEGTELELKK